MSIGPVEVTSCPTLHGLPIPDVTPVKARSCVSGRRGHARRRGPASRAADLTRRVARWEPGSVLLRDIGVARRPYPFRVLSIEVERQEIRTPDPYCLQKLADSPSN